MRAYTVVKFRETSRRVVTRGQRREWSFCLMGMVSVLQDEYNSGDGHNVNVLNVTELYS